MYGVYALIGEDVFKCEPNLSKIIKAWSKREHNTAAGAWTARSV